jgi:hypothetical protein
MEETRAKKYRKDAESPKFKKENPRGIYADKQRGTQRGAKLRQKMRSVEDGTGKLGHERTARTVGSRKARNGTPGG